MLCTLWYRRGWLKDVNDVCIESMPVNLDYLSESGGFISKEKLTLESFAWAGSWEFQKWEYSIDFGE